MSLPANGHELVTYYGRTAEGAQASRTFELTILGATAEGNLIVAAAFIAAFDTMPIYRVL